MNEKVCVSIPLRNGSKFIEQTINSVLYQNYPNFHLNIYEGESTDDTKNKLKKYEKIKNVNIFYTSNLGSPCRAIKRCLELPNADIIIPLMADDFFIHDSVISTFVKEFENNNSDFVYGNSYVIDRKNPSKIIRKFYNFNYSIEDLKSGYHPHWSSVAFKAQLIKDLDFLCSTNNVKFSHVKAHKKKPKNEEDYFTWYGNKMADKLATDAAKSNICYSRYDL